MVLTPSAQPGISFPISASGILACVPRPRVAPTTCPSCRVAVNSTVTQSSAAGVAPVPTTTSTYFKPEAVVFRLGSSIAMMGVACGSAGKVAGAGAAVGIVVGAGASVGAGVADPPPQAATTNTTTTNDIQTAKRFMYLLNCFIDTHSTRRPMTADK